MAIITVSNSGGTRNWTDPLTWVGGVVPLATDSVVFTVTSGNLIINTVSTIVDFDLTFFTNTITFNSYLIINGNWHLGGGIYTYTQLGIQHVRIQGTGTITSNGVIWSRGLRFGGAGITTLIDNFNLSGEIVFQISGGPTIKTINGFNIYHTGTFGVSNNGSISGSTKYWYKGIGVTWSQGASTAVVNIDFYIDTVGTLTLTGTSPNGISFGGGKELKIISGSLNTTGLPALTLNSRVIDFNGVTINKLRLTNTNQTVVLLSNTTVNTLDLVHQTNSNPNVHNINGFEINTTNLLMSVTGGSNTATQGSTIINFVGSGTGTWSNPTGGATILKNSVNINKTLGSTLNITGTIYYSTGTLTYLAGTVNTAGSTFRCSGAATINSNGDPTSTSTISSTGINFNNFNTQFSISGGLVTNATPIRIIGTLTHLYNCTGAVYVNGSLVVLSNSVGNGVSITLNGTGSWTGVSAVRGVNLIIDTLGTITANTNVSISDTTITYVKGTVNTGIGDPGGGGRLTVTTACTFNTTSIAGSLPWNTVVVTSGTHTLLSNLTCQNLSHADARFNGNTIFINGDLTITSATYIIGTSLINMQGTGTWSNTGNGVANFVRHNLTLSGTITISGVVSFAWLTLTTTGTITTSGSTLYLGGNTNTIVNSTAIWNDVVVSGGTQTINSQLLIGGTLDLSGTAVLIFAGTSGFTAANVSCTTAGRTITLASGITYNVTNNLNLVGSNASKILLRSLTTPRAVFTLPYGATQNVQNTNATNIDSSLGQTIYSSAGTLTSTINWSIGSGSNSGNFFIMF